MNIGYKIFIEGPVKIVGGRPPPIASGGLIIQFGRPTIDDALPLQVRLKRNPRVGEGAGHLISKSAADKLKLVTL